jgi:putative tryptophan/tyrosine transport system substrate-binding protein
VELLREVAPNVSRVALLMNPTNPNVDVERMDAEAGARKLGLETVTLNARTRPKSTLHSSSCWVPRPTGS